MSFPRSSFILLCGVLVLVGFFAFRVYGYYQKLVLGTLTQEEIPSLSYQNRLTTSAFSRASATPASSTNVLTDDDPSLGSSSAPLTIVEFGDFVCPYSQEVSHTMRRLAAQFPSVIRYVYRDFPLLDIHPEAQAAAEAAACAHEQGLFWPYHDKLFGNQIDLSDAALLRYAKEVGVDEKTFRSCFSIRAYREEVEEDLSAGQAAGVYGTPTFFLNGTRIEGAIPEEVFTGIVQAFL